MRRDETTLGDLTDEKVLLRTANDPFGGLTASVLFEETVEEELDTTKLSGAELKDYLRQETKPTISILKLILKSILLGFSSFPFKVHSAVNTEASC